MIAKLTDGMKIRCFQNIIRTLCRVGSNFVIVAWNDSISIRSINEYQSALPIIQFKSSFFDEFKFIYAESQLSFEVPSNAFKYSLVSNQPMMPPEKIILTADNNATDKKLKFTINVFDYFEINHYWEFDILENASILKAIIDESNISSTLTCRCDIFEGMDRMFSRNSMVTLHIINTRSKNCKLKKEKRYPIMFTTEKLNYNDCISSILRFEVNDKLTIDINREIFDKQCDLNDNTIKLTFSLLDFLIGVKIASILSQKVTISSSSPGSPLVIKASMPNSISFEMTIATCLDGQSTDSDDEENKVENNRKISKNNPIVYAPSESEREQYLIDNN